MTINPSVANCLQTCTDAQFGKGTHDAVACPDGGEGRHLEDRLGRGAAAADGNGVARSSPSRGTSSGCSCRRRRRCGHPPDRVGDCRPADRPPHHDVRGHAPDAVHRVHDQHDGRAAAVFATPLACGPGQALARSPRGADRRTGRRRRPPPRSTATAPAAGAPAHRSRRVRRVHELHARAAGDTSFTAGVTRADGQQFLSRHLRHPAAGLVGRIPLVPQCSDAATRPRAPAASASRVGTASVLAGAGSVRSRCRGRVPDRRVQGRAVRAGDGDPRGRRALRSRDRHRARRDPPSIR